MINETLLSFSNSSAPIIIKTAVETNWTQFTLSIIVSIFLTFGLLLFLIGGGAIKRWTATHKLKKLTSNPTLMINHQNTGLFDAQMIDGKTMNKTLKFLHRYEGGPVNIILHTPGGSIFYTQQIAAAIRNHGLVNMYVPSMAMSGGTYLALHAHTLLMTTNAALGMVDPQIGMLWKQGSAQDWKTVHKLKGKRMEDDSAVYMNEGIKYTKTIRKELYAALKINGSPEKQARKVSLMLTDGVLEHAKRFTIHEVYAWRDRIELMDKEEENISLKGVL